MNQIDLFDRLVHYGTAVHFPQRVSVQLVCPNNHSLEAKEREPKVSLVGWPTNSAYNLFVSM